MSAPYDKVAAIAKRVSETEGRGWTELPGVITEIKRGEERVGVCADALCSFLKRSPPHEYRQLIRAMQGVALRDSPSDELADAKLQLGILRVVEETSKELGTDPLTLVKETIASSKPVQINLQDFIGPFSKGFYDGSPGLRVKAGAAFEKASLEELMRRELDEPWAELAYFVLSDEQGVYLRKLETRNEELINALSKVTKDRDPLFINELREPLKDNDGDRHVHEGTKTRIVGGVRKEYLTGALDRFEENLAQIPQVELDEFLKVYRLYVMKYIAYRKMQEIPGYQGLLHTHLNYEGHHCDGDLEESQKGQPFYILAYEHKFRRTGLYVLANDGHGQPQIHLANYFTHRPDFCKYFNDHIKPVACTFKRWADQDNVIFGIQSPQGIMSVRIYDPERKHLSPPQFMDNPQEIDVKVDVKKIPKPTLIIVTPDGRMELFKLGH